MTERQMMYWIKNNISPIVRKAIAETNESYFTEADLCAICYREVFGLLHKLVPTNIKFDVLCSLMKGDYSQRENDTEKIYHGFSFWQIDVNTDPEFIKSGEWKNPLKACKKALEILNGKKKQFDKEYEGEQLQRIVFAAYNCGEGNVKRVLKKGFAGLIVDVNKNPLPFERFIDYFTAGRNYSWKVIEYKASYKSVM